MSGRKREYYPSYYRDKRRRERAILALSAVTLGILCISLLVLAGIFLLRPRENLEQLAQRRGEIVATAQKPASAEAFMPAAVPVKDDQIYKPEDITEVAKSVPEMSLAPIQFTGAEQPVDKPPPPQITPEKAANGRGEVEQGQPESESAAPPKPEPVAEQEKARDAEVKKPQQPADKPKPKPEEKPKEQPKPAPKKEAKPAEPTYKYTVYAGVYASESEANRQEERLIGMGLHPKVIIRGQGESKSYLVSVGTALSEYDQANVLKNKLREAGFNGAYILRRET